MCACVCACVRACVCARVCVCVRVCVRVCHTFRATAENLKTCSVSSYADAHALTFTHMRTDPCSPAATRMPGTAREGVGKLVKK